MSESNQVFIGRKPVMNYVLACLTLLQGGSNEITVKARGRAISTAVDVVEIIRRRFMSEIKLKGIKIGTEQFPAEEGGTGPMNVSTIEVTLAR